tara:strand:+ start:1615 stop:1965 length:351 start_codon:yes stop_codon:yes gene_type:complete
MKAPTRARSRKKPTPFPGSPPRGRTKRGKDGTEILLPSKPRRGKGKGVGPIRDITTGKRVRKGPTPFPGSPPRSRNKRGKDGINISLPSKPKRGKGKGMGKLTSTKAVGSIGRKRR